MKKYLFIVLIGVCFFCGCGKDTDIEEFTTPQNKVLESLPANIEFIVYVNFDELKKSNYLESFAANNFLKDSTAFFIDSADAESGKIIKENISETYTISSFKYGVSTIFLFREGTDYIKTYMERKDLFEKINDNNFEFYVNKKRPSLKFFLKENTLYISSNLEFLSEINAGTQPKLSADPFYETVKRIKYKNHYWLAANNGNLAILLMKIVLGERSNPPGKDIIKMSDKFTLSAHFSDNVAVESSLGFKTANYAYLFSGAVNSAISMRIFSKSHPEMSTLFDKLDVKRESKSVYFNILLNKDEVENIKKILIKKKGKYL